MASGEGIGALSPCSEGGGVLSKLAVGGSTQTTKGKAQRTFWTLGSQGAPVPQPVGGQPPASVSQGAQAHRSPTCSSAPTPPEMGGISSVPFLLPGSRVPQDVGALPISSWVRTSFHCPYSQGPWFRGGSGEGGHRDRQKKGSNSLE